MCYTGAMNERPNPTKRTYQLRRARQLVVAFDVLGATRELDAETAHDAARAMPRSFWVNLSNCIDDFNRPPSEETVAMTIEMLRQRAHNEQVSTRRNHGNQIIRNRSY